jgi:hypothetical protein
MARPVPLASVLLPLAVLVAGSAGGCGKDEDKAPPPSGERTEEPAPETPKDAPTGPFAGFDFDAAAQRWQGAWVLPGEQAGKLVAWEIVGDRITQFDGVADKTFAFAIYSPCQITYSDADAGVTTYKTFTFAGEVLHAGLGAAGTVVGGATVACVGGNTYVQRGDTCEQWSELFDDWKQEPAECAIEGEGPTRKLVTPSGEIGFVDATALANEQMQRNVATPHADFAAAKAALTRAQAG